HICRLRFTKRVLSCSRRAPFFDSLKRPAWGRSLFLGGESDAVPKFRSHVLSDDSEPRNLLQQTLVKLLFGRRFHAVFLAPFRVSEKQFFPGIRKARADLAAFGKK